MKSVIKKIISRSALAYHSLRAKKIIWWSVLNRRGRNRFNKYPPTLTEIEKKLISEINSRGIAVSNISALGLEKEFKTLQDFVQKRWVDADVKVRYDSRHAALRDGRLVSKDLFLINLWEGKCVLDLTHPAIEFSLSHPILNVVNSYLHLWAKFRDWRLQVTVPMPAGEREYASQRWHRDPEDQKLVKVFLYLNDVDEDAGPFTYLAESHEGGKWRHLFPQKPPSGSAGNDSDIPKEDIVVLTGKAGTVIFWDTSGLHRGGYARKNNRFMYTSIFTTPASVWPINFVYPQTFRTNNIEPRIHWAVSNNAKQKKPKLHKLG